MTRDKLKLLGKKKNPTCSPSIVRFLLREQKDFDRKKTARRWGERPAHGPCYECLIGDGPEAFRRAEIKSRVSLSKTSKKKNIDTNKEEIGKEGAKRRTVGERRTTDAGAVALRKSQSLRS